MTYVYLTITILCTVAGQLVTKHGTNNLGQMPTNVQDGAIFLFKALANIYVITGFVFAFVASLSWIAAVSKLELSFAYPFMSLNFVFVLLLSAIIFHEQINMTRLIGVAAICVGVYFISRS
jgi:drug/metabolite transporter (DMT)-like permease